ncbi:MAG: DUF6265 family protein [Planctomycetota bacterium]
MNFRRAASLSLLLTPIACVPLQSAFGEKNAAPPPADAPAAADDAFAPARFLVGTWVARDGDGDRQVLRTEAWTAPADGVMHGVSRTERGDRLLEFELLRIALRDGVLQYEARPAGRGATWFALDRAEPERITFAAPEHDFPKRIHYWLAGPGELRAAIDDGTDDKRMEFGWRRGTADGR